MLDLTGNSEVVFASLNSINAQPIVYIEWNYNALSRPYVVTSNATGTLASASGLQVASAWSPSGGYITTAAGLGIISDVDTTGNALSISTGGGMRVTASSTPFTVTPSANSYYKIVFYVKSNNQIVSTPPAVIPKSAITATPSSPGAVALSYRVVPISHNGVRPPTDLDGLDLATASVSSFTSGSVTVSWNSTGTYRSPLYNIYRSLAPSASSTNLAYITTVPLTSATSTVTTYIDNLGINPTQIDALPIPSSNVRIIPSVYLTSGGNALETTRYFMKVSPSQFAPPEIIRGMVDLNPLIYQRVELFFGSPTTFDSVSLIIDVDAYYQGAQVLLYRPEVYQIDEWNFYNTTYYPVESLFTANRPGESLLNPFILTADTLINKSLLTASTTTVKPVAFGVSNPDAIYGGIQPYKQFYDNTLNNTMKYYVSDILAPAGQPQTSQISIRAQYNNYMSVNKIIIKGSNCFSDLTKASGSITLLGPGGGNLVTVPFSSSTGFSAAGLLDFFWNGLAWSTIRPSDGTYPPRLTDDGILQNVTSSVTGIVFTINNIGVGDTNTIGNYSNTRAHIIEISPRLEIDISNHVVSLEIDKTIDNADSAAGFPLGYINSNTAKVEIDNMPLYKNSFPHTMFEPYAKNATFSDLVRENVKFWGAMKSPRNDFTDTVPLFTMYSEDWQVNHLSTITATLYDSTKTHLMMMEAPDYFGENENMFMTVTNLLDAVGYSDYDYDGLKEIMSRKATNTTHFWSDKTTTTLQVALRDFFVAHQIGSFFDEYGILRFTDIDQIISQYLDNTFYPDFAITDIPVTIVRKPYSTSSVTVNYIPNIVTETYQMSHHKKIGQVTLEYQIPVKSYTDTLDTLGKSTKAEQPMAVWSETKNAAVVKSLASSSVPSNQNYFYSDPHWTEMHTMDQTPRYTLGNQQGSAFLQGELISWNGFSYKFVPVVGVDGTLSPLYSAGFNAIVSNTSDLNNHISDFTNQDSRISQVKFNFTGNVMGVTRGDRFTTVRNHNLFHDTLTKSGFLKSSGYFNKSTLTGKGTGNYTGLSSIYGSINFENNIAVINSIRNLSGKTYPIVLSPAKQYGVGDYQVPTSASTFNYFSFVFSAPPFSAYSKTKWADLKDDKQLEVGFFVNTTNGLATFVLANDRGKTVLKPSYDATVGDVYSNYLLQSYVSGRWTTTSIPPVKNVFDGASHRLSVLFHDKSWASPSQPDSSGNMSYQFCTFFIDGSRYGPFRITTVDGKSTRATPKDRFGFYTRNVSTAKVKGKLVANPLKVHLTEIYACRWSKNNGTELNNVKTKWHWESRTFLNGIMTDNPNIEPPYYFWGPNVLTGINFYDKVDFLPAPAYVTSISSDYAGYDLGNQINSKATLGPTKPNSIKVSHINATPFRARFAVVNSDEQAVFLSTSTGQVDGGNLTPFQLQGFYNKPGDANTLTRVIDPTSIANTVHIKTNWIQSEYDAQMLIDKIGLISHSFNSDVSVTIFGNPLIQIGDFGQMVYSAKNIGYNPEAIGTSRIIPQMFYTTGVTQRYTAPGLQTDLILKPVFSIPL